MYCTWGSCGIALALALERVESQAWVFGTALPWSWEIWGRLSQGICIYEGWHAPPARGILFKRYRRVDS